MIDTRMRTQLHRRCSTKLFDLPVRLLRSGCKVISAGLRRHVFSATNREVWGIWKGSMRCVVVLKALDLQAHDIRVRNCEPRRPDTVCELD
jgi:hypothetical protein